MTSIEFIISPGEPSSKLGSIYHEKIYHLWNDIWQKTFEEFGIYKKIYSDSFHRQDFILGLFYQQNCIGAILLKWMNTKLSSLWQESYFSQWPQSDQQFLQTHYEHILVPSYMCISPEARSEKMGFSTKGLLINLCTEALMASNMEALASNVRTDRGVSAAFQKFGWKLISDQVKSPGGLPGHFVVFEKSFYSKIQTLPEIQWARTVWKNRIELERPYLQFSSTNLTPQFEAIS